MVRRPILLCAAILAGAAAVAAQSDTADQVRAAEELLESGDLPGAVLSLRRIVAGAPRSFEARLALGRALDLEGRHAAARAHLEEALRLARGAGRDEALTSLGISYAFESKADEAARYYQRAFDAQVQANDRGTAAALANALGRIYLESGNLQKAEQWYTTGYETVRQVAGLTAEQRALWEMRRRHAFARIAALLDRGGNENQRPFYPYLLGYIAFHLRDYRDAVEHLTQAAQDDPFVLGLLAQTHERLGDRARAADYYRQVMAVHAHSINTAFSRPRARRFLR